MYGNWSGLGELSRHLIGTRELQVLFLRNTPLMYPCQILVAYIVQHYHLFVIDSACNGCQLLGVDPASTLVVLSRKAGGLAGETAPARYGLTYAVPFAGSKVTEYLFQPT